MKKKNIYILSGILALLLMMPSCYEDKGNYDYHDINEIEVDGIEPLYVLDMDESLIIKPRIEGTMYSDTSKFSYQWEIGGTIVSTQHDLDYVINLTTGSRICRFIVADKQTGVKTYKRFNLNVTSSTAGDLIMVLSKYQGKAELSYFRILTPQEIADGKQANWAVNYYENRFEEPLGENPQQLAIIYCESNRNQPFVNAYGRIMVLTDDQFRLIDKSTLVPESVSPYLMGEDYTGVVSYPPPNIEGYRSQFAMEGFYIWRENPLGMGYQLATHFVEISGGALYIANSMAPSSWSVKYHINVKSPRGGILSPFCFWEDMSPDLGKATQITHSHILGNIIVFDQSEGRIMYGTPHGKISLYESLTETYPGYRMVWGSSTNLGEKSCLAVLSNGADHKLILFKGDNAKTPDKTLTGQLGAGSTMNEGTRFYMMKYSPYLLYVTDGKLYRYNIMDIGSGTPPSESNVAVKLSDLGYDASARITDICVSRSEKTLLLGVSRYGSDTEAMGDEAKGDLLYFDLNASTITMEYNAEKSAKGISGIPVDVQIKYQTHYYDGMSKGTKGGELVDHI